MPIKKTKDDGINPELEDIPTRATANKIYKNEKQKKAEEHKEYVPVISPRQTVEIPAKPRPTREQIEKIETPKQSTKEDRLFIKKGLVVEKAAKAAKIETVEKIDKIGTVKKTRKSKATTGVIEIKTKTPRFETLKGNSILIITEKPQAAAKIAAALSNGKDKKYGESGVSYYEFDREEGHIIVACAVGHLFSLSQDVKGSSYPIFEVSWKPNFEVRKKDFTRKYYLTIAKLAKRAREIIVATDYDIEGEVIGYNIIRFIAHQRDAKRMKYSSLTKDELEQAFLGSSTTIDWGQAIAGETRHYIDWYYGINLSRALMNSIKSTGKFKIMSIGRVQGPALKMIVDKEREIAKFKPVPYWKIFIDIREQKDKTNKAKLRHIKDIFDEKELAKFEKLKGKIAQVKTDKHEQTIIPPAPFDLTTLQTEAYKFFGINPAKTLALAQELYLAGLISYPRTSSQKIPEAINPKQILKKLEANFKETKLGTRARPIEGKKSDPAHPSISPTGEYVILEGDNKKIYELIVKRFISCFCEDAILENKTMTAESEGLVFKDHGMEIRKPGWMQVYPSKMQEKELKDMNGLADIIKVEIEKDETKPPRRFSPASIISELEKAGLGTKATRANILETLYDRNYVEDQKSIRATPLGINLIETLEKYSSIIIDQKLTKDMEKDMEAIRISKKDLEKKQETILNKAEDALKKISDDFHKKERVIGEELNKATLAYYKQQSEENEITECPACKKGKLTIKYSPRNRRYFIACNAYPNCKTTFSLPPYGMIKKLGEDKLCEKCGLPLLMSLQKGKRPWIFCFNPDCPSRAEREKQKAAQEAEQDNKKPIEQENIAEEEKE